MATGPTSPPAAGRTSCACTPRRCTAFHPSRWSAPPACTTYGYDKDGKPFLTKDPKLLLNDDNAGKPEGIHFVIGRRPYASFGNSTGDRQMLEYAKAGEGERLAVLVLHDDAEREYAYGPAQGFPTPRSATFTQELYDEAEKERLDHHQHEGRLEDAYSRMKALHRGRGGRCLVWVNVHKEIPVMRTWLARMGGVLMLVGTLITSAARR